MPPGERNDGRADTSRLRRLTFASAALLLLLAAHAAASPSLIRTAPDKLIVTLARSAEKSRVGSDAVVGRFR